MSDTPDFVRSCALVSRSGPRASASLLLLAAVLLATPARAVSIDYQVEMGFEPQFAFSFVHSALHNCCGAPAQYFNNGLKLLKLSGTVEADFDAGLKRSDVVVDSALTAEVLGPAAAVLSVVVPGTQSGDLWTLVIKAGSFLEEAPNGRAEGELVYELFDEAPGQGGNQIDAGTFYVFPEDVFPASANRVDAGRFNAWANNWENGSEDPPVGNVFATLGIDLVSMPEPSVAVLLATALAGLAWKGRRPPRES